MVAQTTPAWASHDSILLISVCVIVNNIPETHLSTQVFSGSQITRINLHWPVQFNTMDNMTGQYGWGDGWWHIIEIQSSPSVSTPLFPPGLYADVSSVCAVSDVGTPVQGPETPVQGPEVPVQGWETPVQGPEAPSPQLPLSAQEQLASPWIFSSSEITKGVFKSTNKGASCICFKQFFKSISF